MDAEFDRALQVLQRYISPVNARSVLERTLRQQGLEHAHFERNDLRKCADNLRRAAKLFVDSSRLSSALRDIGELCGGSTAIDGSVVQITVESDVAKARAEARRICDALGAGPFIMQKVATIVSELARNMVLYAGGGLVEIESSSPQRIVVHAKDNGPGILNLTDIMSGRYRSKTGLGRGLLGTKRLADRFDISTDTTGTRVVAEIVL